MQEKLLLISFPRDNCKSKTDFQLITNTRISTYSRVPLAPRKVFEKPHEEAKQVLQSDPSFNTSVAEDYSSATSFGRFILALLGATLSGIFFMFTINSAQNAFIVNKTHQEVDSIWERD